MSERIKIPNSIGKNPEAYGTDATGADTYATVLTPTADHNNILIILLGSNGAVVSVDGGTTDQIPVPAQSILVLPMPISNAVAIKAKNLTAGSNYANLYIMVW